MATKKPKAEPKVKKTAKKKDSITLEMPGTIGSAKIVLPKEKKSKKQTPNVDSGGWPKISQGTHLTVKTFEDGHTELVWDDEQLLKEVREAIASVELANMKPNVKAKVVHRKKKEAAMITASKKDTTK